MKMSRFILLIAGIISVILFSGCSENSKKATETGKSFLVNLYTCNFKAADVLCTDYGKEEVRWFASNLTKEDLAIISSNVEVETETCEFSDSTAFIVYIAKNVIVCDSLETKSHIGTRSITVILKNVNSTWKVDKLKW